VATADIFREPALPRNTPAITWDTYTFDATQNDCQTIVCDRHPEVALLLQWLLQFAPSRMTGTGACVFAIFSDENSARRVLDTLPRKWTGFVAKGVNTSPLLRKLKTVNEASDMN
jgi:4-diphosphocytidyl-2-C-methyl-D-erythritol kinase